MPSAHEAGSHCLAAACALVDEQAVHVALPERELHRLLVREQLAVLRHLEAARGRRLSRGLFTKLGKEEIDTCGRYETPLDTV